MPMCAAPQAARPMAAGAAATTVAGTWTGSTSRAADASASARRPIEMGESCCARACSRWCTSSRGRWHRDHALSGGCRSPVLRALTHTRLNRLPSGRSRASSDGLVSRAASFCPHFIGNRDRYISRLDTSIISCIEGDVSITICPLIRTQRGIDTSFLIQYISDTAIQR